MPAQLFLITFVSKKNYHLLSVIFDHLLNMAKHNDIGQWGEQLARDYLLTHGYTVMSQNAHIGHKELDIIALRGNRMIFVEVKTRTQNLDDALDAIDEKKINRIVRAADSFLQQFTAPYEYQFDIIAIVGTPETGHTLTHIEDAFFPPLTGAR